MNFLDIILFTILDVLSWLIVARCLCSLLAMFAQADFIYRINEILIRITDPILMPFKKILEIIPGINRFPVDFSAFLALLVISLLQFLL